MALYFLFDFTLEAASVLHIGQDQLYRWLEERLT